MFRTAEKEYEDNRFLCEAIENEIIRKRIDSNLRWFIKKAVTAKKCYYLFSAVTIICPIVSGIVLVLPIDDTYGKIISSIIMGISAVSAAFLTLFDFRNKWALYRNQAEQIKTLLSYHTVSESKSEEALMKKIEKSMSNSNRKWLNRFDNNVSEKISSPAKS